MSTRLNMETTFEFQTSGIFTAISPLHFVLVENKAPGIKNWCVIQLYIHLAGVLVGNAQIFLSCQVF